MRQEAYIDLDEILWKAFSNLRIINVKYLFNQFTKGRKFDKIYVFGDFTNKSYMEDIRKELEDLQHNYKIIIVDGYNETEGKNLTDIVLLNTFYQNFMEQENIDDTEYTFGIASTKYLSGIKFIQELSGKKINLIVGDAIPYVDQLAETFNIIYKIDMLANNKTVQDKLVIKEIINIVKWGEENKHWMSIKNVIEKCEVMSNIKHADAVFMTKALLAQKIIEKRKLIHQEDGMQYVVLVIGDEETVEKFLSIHHI